MSTSVDRDGFALVREAISSAQRDSLAAMLGEAQGAGRRGLLGTPAVRTLAISETLLKLVAPHLASPFRPVRAIFFDKSPDANWLVPWHQDVTIAVRERCEAPGFGPWSVKEGIPHVQPPVELLEQMLAVRIHLDDCDADNGALRVLPDTHLQGRLSPEQIAAARAAGDEVLCAAAPGDVLLMRPLLLHASSRSTSSRRRRVLHLEYCAAPLPPGLAWHDAA